ncbi:hypothetical protein [Modicisalibacter ilicicola]|uniref:hypothetical protein n=1 Tax=Modicisalibacter ilicicola TaxID=480814 RepID=UPI001FE3EAA4|nr:hypothetical protein [Halomonas ilicicola]
MLKQPATISIVPSRLRWATQALLVAGLCLLVGAYGPPWLLVVVLAALCLALGREWRREQPWALRWIPGPGGGWQTRRTDAEGWRDVALSCDYLGPWLIGLRVGGERRWLWPDSASRESRRALRRLLLWSPSGA